MVTHRHGSIKKGLQTEQPKAHGPRVPPGLCRSGNWTVIYAPAGPYQSFILNFLFPKPNCLDPDRTTCSTFSALSYNTCTCLLASGPLLCFPLL